MVFGRVQTSIATSLSAPQLMDKIMEIDEQQDTIQRMKHSLNTIYTSFEKHYGYDMRNAVWLIDELSYDEVENMKQYYNEEDFKYFGLENLYNVRNRIEHYLKSTKIKFSDSIYEYNKYDEVYVDFKKERLTIKASEKFTYYETKLLQHF